MTHRGAAGFAAWARQALESPLDDPDEMIPVLMHRASALRAAFVERSGLPPPAFLRLIHCERSLKERSVVLIDDGQLLNCSYTAISHTYGAEVYDVFNCDCATRCITKKLRADPSKTPCRGHAHDQNPRTQQAVIGDVLRMCQILVEKGETMYAWHDGVCIAQHDKEEVKHFIEHMGWIYANAKDTIIFPHYIARPMAPIAPTAECLTSRWQTRAWTFQEAVLSKRRRYCVRYDYKGANNMKDCMDRFRCVTRTPQQFEKELSSWYHEPAGDSNITIMEEPDFYELVLKLCFTSAMVGLNIDMADDPLARKFDVWRSCLLSWFDFLACCCLSFPTTAQVLHTCSRRESKHEGDRINSILGLVGVQNFSAEKDEQVEENTMELFKRMKNGLAIAVFATNERAPPSTAIASIHKHTWLPSLCGPLQISYLEKHYKITEENFHMMTDEIEFEVLEDGNIQLQGLLAACVNMDFMVMTEASEHPTSPKKAAELKRQSDTLGQNLYYNVSFAGFDMGDAYIPNLNKDDGSWAARYLNIEQFFNFVSLSVGSDEDVENAFQARFGYAAPSADIKGYYCQKLFMPTVKDWSEPVEISDLSNASFCASIIFPAKLPDLTEIEPFFPAILVQGNIHSQAVAKIGRFVGSKEFLGLMREATCIKIFNRLVIE